jgi:hypothetical protein
VTHITLAYLGRVSRLGSPCPGDETSGDAPGASPLIADLVARGGVEPPTYRFSGGRSYQLSYLARSSGRGTRTLATLTGLEPATFAVTGRRANQLRHRALLYC